MFQRFRKTRFDAEAVFVHLRQARVDLRFGSLLLEPYPGGLLVKRVHVGFRQTAVMLHLRDGIGRFRSEIAVAVR